MAIEVKIQVLHAPEIVERTRPNGTPYFQRPLQCFVLDGVCVHTVYADKKEDLEKYQAGYYMANLKQQAGDRARMAFVVDDLRPVVQGKTS
jgi:hypothetical protein